MKENVELRVIGITYNQIENAVYAVVLEDIQTKRRLAIVIGHPEAQSIECSLQRIKTPRPLGHDLMVSMIESFGATLLRVDIEKLPSGPYAGRLTFADAEGEVKIVDARSSDAIALAIRIGAPIFATRHLLDTEGFSADNPSRGTSLTKRVTVKKAEPVSELSRLPLDKLNEKLALLVEQERYEEAELVRRELEKRKSSK